MTDYEIRDELYGLGCHIGSLESRIGFIEWKADNATDGSKARIDAIDARLSRIERLLNHKGGIE